jgi:hypothetical protein
MRQNPVGEPAATAAWNFGTPRRRSSWMDLLRKSGEFPVSNEELDDTATTVYEGI